MRLVDDDPVVVTFGAVVVVLNDGEDSLLLLAAAAAVLVRGTRGTAVDVLVDGGDFNDTNGTSSPLDMFLCCLIQFSVSKPFKKTEMRSKIR